MSIQSLRQNQINEILDADYLISRQVVDRQKKQAQTMNDNVAPKRIRDLDIEVNSDKIIESLNEKLNSKLATLEIVLSGGLDKKSQLEIIDTSLASGSWNQLVRYYQTPALSRQSQEILKVKVQDLSTNIDAMVYGLSKLIENLTDADSTDIISFSKSLAVYRSIQDQLKQGSFILINPNEVTTQVKNIVSDLPENKREKLESIFNQRQIKDKNVFPSSDFKQRLANIESELGFTFPDEEIERLKSELPKEIQSRFSSGIGLLKKEARDLPDLIAKIQLLQAKRDQLVNYQTDIQDSKDDYKLDEVGDAINELDRQIEIAHQIVAQLETYLGRPEPNDNLIRQRLEEREEEFNPQPYIENINKDREEKKLERIGAEEEKLEEVERVERTPQEYKDRFLELFNIPSNLKSLQSESERINTEAGKKILNKSGNSDDLVKRLVDYQEFGLGDRRGRRQAKTQEQERDDFNQLFLEYSNQLGINKSLEEASDEEVERVFDAIPERLMSKYSRSISRARSISRPPIGKGKPYRHFGLLKQTDSSSDSSSDSDSDCDPLTYDESRNDPYKNYIQKRRF